MSSLEIRMTYFWIIYSWLIVGTGILCERKFERQQAASSCSGNNEDNFYCSQKVCIEWSWVCDGYKDCSNGSDEDKDMCARYDHGTNMTMDCGQVRIKNQVISEKGNTEAKVGTAPWYVLIFELRLNGYEWLRGGSIIAPKVVISEAKYLRTKGTIQTYDASNNYGTYKICAGICGFRFPINNTDLNQIINVEKIYIGEGFENDYNHNIAFIVLENKISFSNGLAAPVCIDWTNKYNVVNGDQGKVVVGTVVNNNITHSDEQYLLEKNSSYFNYNICQKIYPSDYNTSFIQGIISDKFCATYITGENESVFGVLGTGISFLHSSSYFLTGVNIADINLRKCNMVHDYIGIKHHIRWIRGLLNKHVTVNTCVLPTVEGVVYSYKGSNEILPYGTLIDRYLTVDENCEVGYHNANPNRFRVCKRRGKWSSNSNKLCFKMCPPLESDSLDIKCSHNGEYANCSNPSLPDTIARPSCKPAYYNATEFQKRTPLELLCQSNGMWNKQLYACNPYCGRVNFNNKILNDRKVNVESAPWNAALYRFNKNIPDYDLICGGSIISSNLVVTAASCFDDDFGPSKIIPVNDSRYKIAVGKYNRTFSTIDNEFTKIMNVKIVYLKENYTGFPVNTQHFLDDLAIIVLENRLSFNEGVAPICIDWNGKYNEDNGSEGKVYYWILRTIPNSKSFLLESTLQYVNRTACMYMSFGNEPFVAVDKFCAITEMEHSVVNTGVGFGLCFLHSSSYYLIGLTSCKFSQTNYSVVTLTDIMYHIEWIRKMYDKYNLF